jgi:hypothetical protein
MSRCVSPIARPKVLLAEPTAITPTVTRRVPKKRTISHPKAGSHGQPRHRLCLRNPRHRHKHKPHKDADGQSALRFRLVLELRLTNYNRLLLCLQFQHVGTLDFAPPSAGSHRFSNQNFFPPYALAGFLTLSLPTPSAPPTTHTHEGASTT